MTRFQRVLLLTPFALVVVPFLIWPAVFGFVASFTNYAPFQPDVQFIGLKNYARVLQDSTFLVLTDFVV